MSRENHIRLAQANSGTSNFAGRQALSASAPARSPRRATSGSIRGSSGKTRLASSGALDLDQLLDLEAGVAQQGDHLAVREVELDRVVVGPLEPVHAELRPHQPLAGLAVLVVGRGRASAAPS